MTDLRTDFTLCHAEVGPHCEHLFHVVDGVLIKQGFVLLRSLLFVGVRSIFVLRLFVFPVIFSPVACRFAFSLAGRVAHVALQDAKEEAEHDSQYQEQNVSLSFTVHCCLYRFFN